MLFLLPLLACVHPSSPAAAPGALLAGTSAAGAPEDVSTVGVTDPRLRGLLHDHWETTMRRSPTWASQLGDHRYDDRLDDISDGARAESLAEREGFADRAAAIPPEGLSESDRATLELFRGELVNGRATDVCHAEQWGLSARNNPLLVIGELGELQTVDSPAAGEAYLARLRAFSRYVADDEANLRAGIAARRTPDRASVDIVLAQLDTELRRPVRDWPAAAPALTERAGWQPLAAAVFRDAVLDTLEGDALPALRRYRAFLADELRPAARDKAHTGAWALPDGEACYAALIRQHTSLALSAPEIHAIGLAELESIHAEMRTLGERLFGTSELPAIFARLRDDPALRFTTEVEVEDHAIAALAAARARIPAFFGRLPEAECGVRRVPDQEAPYTTIAYYRPVVPGEQPGYYYINTYAPDTRPRFEAEVLAFHESIPGHHLQIAIAQELPALPAFRRHLGTTAFVEGWALYTERLADEMGLYTGDLDRMGMLSFDTWRASRLVVDTGVHALGWDRARAEQFMLDNTPLAANNIHNEVDRYVTWPGQALAYKLGQLEIRALRAEAAAALGPAFSLPRFHDVVLGSGAVPLPFLRTNVERWIAAGG